VCVVLIMKFGLTQKNILVYYFF